MRVQTGDSRANDPAPYMLTPAAKACHPTERPPLEPAVATLLAAVVASAIFMVGCKSNSREAPARTTAGFAVFGVQPTADDQFAIPVVLANGKTWYRESESGIPLADLDPQRVIGPLPFEGKWAVTILVLPDRRDALETWTKGRVGKHVVSFLDGEAVGEVMPLFDSVRVQVSFSFSTESAALTWAMRMRELLR